MYNQKYQPLNIAPLKQKPPQVQDGIKSERKSERARSENNYPQLEEQLIIKNEENDDDILKDFRPLKNRVEEMVSNVQPHAKLEFLDELRRQLKEKYFSPTAIDDEKKTISFKLFFYPSEELAKLIESVTGTIENSIIYNSVALRHGDLLMIKNKELRNYGGSESKKVKLASEIEHIMTHLIPWGTYLIDLKKLETMATSKSGNSQNRKYMIGELDIEVIIDDGVTVKYKNNAISPSNLKNYILKEMAIDRLRQKATEVFYQILTKNDIVL